MRLWLVIVCVLASNVLACKRPPPAPPASQEGLQVPELLPVRRGLIGAVTPMDGVWAYALVKNTSEQERMVVVGGALIDAQGKELYKVRDDEQRIPPGATRPFALVHAAPSPEAVSMSVVLRRNEVPETPNPVVVYDVVEERAPMPGDVAPAPGISDAAVAGDAPVASVPADARDAPDAAATAAFDAGSTDVGAAPTGPIVTATGHMRNEIEQPLVATIVAAFYDASGEILARPFTILQFPARAVRPFRFKAPAGAVRVEIFVSEVQY